MLFGIRILSFPLSIAVFNLTDAIEFFSSSSFTSGTVYCSSLIDKGSKPATKAEVSKTITLFSFSRV